VFAQDRNSPNIADPHLLLIPVHENKDIFTYQKEFPEEKNLPFIFPRGDKKKQPGNSAIVSEKEFQRNFELFTESQLRFLNWDNVFAAGGRYQFKALKIVQIFCGTVLT